jgi:hypothetical protein
VQAFRQLAREENSNLQMIFPMTEVVGRYLRPADTQAIRDKVDAMYG